MNLPAIARPLRVPALRPAPVRPWTVPLVVLACLALCEPQACGQLPTARLTAIFPPGAQQGSQVELTLASGSDLEGASRLIFSHPGITAAAKLQAVEGQTEPQPVPNVFLVSVAADVPPGFYDLRAVGTYGATNPRAFLVGTTSEVIETEPNNSPTQPMTIALDQVVNGRSDVARDLDFYRFEGRAGQRVVINCLAERIDSRMDAALELFDPQGRLLATSRDARGRDPQLDVVLPGDGGYLVEVYDFQYAGGAEYVYRLAVCALPQVEAVWPPAVAAGSSTELLVLGQNLPEGQLRDDWLAAGRPLEARPIPFAWPGEATAALRQWAEPVSPAGAALDALLVGPAAVAGWQGAAPVWVATAPVVVEHEPNDAPAAAQAVELPCEVAGRFQSIDDADWYRFQAAKGEVVVIDVLAHRLGIDADPYLIVELVTKNEQGEEQTRRLAEAGIDIVGNVGPPSFNTATDDPTFRLEAPDDGTYQVMVRDLYGQSRGDARLIYRLALRRPAPDFRVVALPEFPNDPGAAPQPWTLVVRRGGSDKLTCVAFRVDGFDGPIEIAAAELPPGVTAPPVWIGPGQTLGTLVFSAADDAAEFAGPIRLVARAAGDSAAVEHPVRPATVIWPGAANLPAPARLTRELVLSVAGEAPYATGWQLPGEVLWQGQLVRVAATLRRRGDFTAAVAAAGAGLPGKVTLAAMNFAEGAGEAQSHLVVAADAPLGRFTAYLQASAAVPFTKNPDGSDKKPLNVILPSNPASFEIVAGPLVIAPAVPGGGALKRGGQLTIPVKLTRRNEFAGPVVLDLYVPPGVAGIAAEPVEVAPDATDAALVVTAAADATEGTHPLAAVRARLAYRDQNLELHQPSPLVVQP